MLGFRPGIFWRVCWTYISPLFLLVSWHFFIFPKDSQTLFTSRQETRILRRVIILLPWFQCVCIFSLTSAGEAEDLKYPRWSVKIGWILTASSLVCIPLYIAYIFAVTPGNLVQVRMSDYNKSGGMMHSSAPVCTCHLFPMYVCALNRLQPSSKCNRCRQVQFTLRRKPRPCSSVDIYFLIYGNKSCSWRITISNNLSNLHCH